MLTRAWQGLPFLLCCSARSPGCLPLGLCCAPGCVYATLTAVLQLLCLTVPELQPALCAALQCQCFVQSFLCPALSLGLHSAAEGGHNLMRHSWAPAVLQHASNTVQRAAADPALAAGCRSRASQCLRCGWCPMLSRIGGGEPFSTFRRRLLAKVRWSHRCLGQNPTSPSVCCVCKAVPACAVLWSCQMLYWVHMRPCERFGGALLGQLRHVWRGAAVRHHSCAASGRQLQFLSFPGSAEA